jgi:transcription antitermination factor NusG
MISTHHSYGVADPIFSSVASKQAPWYAVRLRERFRERTEAAMSGLKCDVFSPRCRETRQWTQYRVGRIDTPLFANYVFCQFDAGLYRKIADMTGVIEVVRRGKDLAEVDAGELEAIAQALQVQPKGAVLCDIIPGQRVRVVAGAMAGVEGVLAQVRSGMRLLLQVSAMSCAVAVEVDRDCCEPI